MANKRMFSLQVVDTDKFMDMPVSAQALYFHLGMHGDDDGFVSSPRKIARAAGCNDDDMRLLAAKGFIIPFETGVIVITDWKVNNTLKNDRYQETIYQAEKATLSTEKSGRYILGSIMDPERNQYGTIVEPQHNITKPRSNTAGKPPNLHGDICSFAVQLLNELTGYSYRTTTKKTQTVISARVREGFTQSDFEAVIRHKCKQWLNDEKMREYLRPETLFGPKFEGYLNDARRSAPKEQAVILAPLEDPFEAEMAAKGGGVDD